jgi:outer membrane protein assembly factor BamB
MKLIFTVLILIFLQNCSFDNKTGIWKNEHSISKKEDNDIFKEFKTIAVTNKVFNETSPIDNKFVFKLTNPINNLSWGDIFYSQGNNQKNFLYKNLNKLNFKTKKITKHKNSYFLLFEENNIITNDSAGNINIFAINQNKFVTKFNFYKKKYKKVKKILNLIVEDNIIYVSDNIGYIYAFNYKINKIIWAKNYKIPFRSNLKISNNKLIAVNQNNNLFFLNKKNGEILTSIPTEKTIIKNEFVNNLSLNEKYVFFLNTYGSLYGIDLNNMRINWFINLNQSLELNPSSLFKGNQVVNNSNLVVVNSNQFTNIIDSRNGNIIYKKNFTSTIKPLIINNYLFSITNNDLLISMDLANGEIIYSLDINNEIAEFLDIKKQKVKIKNLMMLNNEIFVFLKNSYLVKFNTRGKLQDVSQLPVKINTHPILINGSLLYLDAKNKLCIID